MEAEEGVARRVTRVRHSCASAAGDGGPAQGNAGGSDDGGDGSESGAGALARGGEVGKRNATEDTGEVKEKHQRVRHSCAVDSDAEASEVTETAADAEARKGGSVGAGDDDGAGEGSSAAPGSADSDDERSMVPTR